MIFLALLLASMPACSARRKLVTVALPSTVYIRAATVCLERTVAATTLPPEKAAEFCTAVLRETAEAAKAAARAAAVGGWNPPIVAYPGGWYGPGVTTSATADVVHPYGSYGWPLPR